MTAGHFDLGAAARREMIQDGFDRISRPELTNRLKRSRKPEMSSEPARRIGNA